VREIRVVTPKSGYRLADNAVRRLQFDPAGEHLLLSVGGETFQPPRTRYGVTLFTASHDLRTGQTLRLEPTGYYAEVSDIPDVTVSPHGRFLAFQYGTVSWASETLVALIDLTQDDSVLDLETGDGRLMEFAFTPDSETLLATRSMAPAGDPDYELVQIPVVNLTGPPIRTEPAVNPLNRQPYLRVVRDTRWRRVAALPGVKRASALGVSADGRLVAVGTQDGRLLVADRKRKRVTLTREWSGKLRGDRVVQRAGFDPRAEWVTGQANGRLFAEPLKRGVGEPWETKPKFGYLYDFAYHPAGNLLAVVDHEGSARFLDPLTGEVRQSFRWRRGPLYSVAFSPDGLTCAAGAGGGRVILWDVDV
jgi:WD40 repeat protein